MTTDAWNSRENNVRDREKKAPTPFFLMSCCYGDLVGAVGYSSTMAVTMAVSGVCVCILSILFSSLTVPQTDFRISSTSAVNSPYDLVHGLTNRSVYLNGSRMDGDGGCLSDWTGLWWRRGRDGIGGCEGMEEEIQEKQKKQKKERGRRGEGKEKKGNKHITVISLFGMKVKLNGLVMRAMNCLGGDMYSHQSIPLALLLH